MKRELIIGKYTLESLTNGMYTSPLDMYREYIQNAVDSFDEALRVKIEFPDKLRIDIDIDQAAKAITIRDNGCGVKAENAASTLLDIGNSKRVTRLRADFAGSGGWQGLAIAID